MVNIITGQQIGEECIICEEHKYSGIHLHNYFICMDCEKDIIQTETNDVKYKYFLEKLRKMSCSEK